MLLYLETDLDRAYKIDCKERSKNKKPWIKREEFRGLYEELIEMYLQKAEDHLFVDISLEDVPAWIRGEIERTLQNEIQVMLDEENI